MKRKIATAYKDSLHITCDRCKGYGWVYTSPYRSRADCDACKGYGIVPRSTESDLKARRKAK